MKLTKTLLLETEPVFESADLERLAYQNACRPVTLRASIGRGVQILRYYRWSQIVRRGWKMVRRRFTGDREIPAFPNVEPVRRRTLNAPMKRLAGMIVDSQRGHISHLDCDLAQGKFVLLGETRHLGNPPDWSGMTEAGPPTRLWSFQLQYQEYLLSHLADRSANDGQIEEDAWTVVWSLMDDWLQRHSPEMVTDGADAWHPYCISRRVPVWIWLLSLQAPPPELERRMLSSMARQAEYLQSNLEFDLGGNHLLENLAALALAGSFLETPAAQRWLDTAERLLVRELKRQILADGEHFERTPAYHCQVLGNLLRIGLQTKDIAPRLQQLATGYAQRMIEFLVQILHTDGEIPLLGDSHFYEGPGVDQLRLLADACGLTWPETTDGMTGVGGYRVFRASAGVAGKATGSCVVFDGGELAANSLPAHAHCDLTGLEASWGGRRWLVDSGNFDYEEGSMRQYCRSSIAHNVLTVSGGNQCDIWSRFRMGRRARPQELIDGQQGEFSYALGGHNGYRHLGVPWLQRLVAVRRNGDLLVADHPRSRTALELIGFVHLAPDVKIVAGSDEYVGEEYLLENCGVRRRIRFFGCDRVEIRTGWYCPAFGHRQPQSVFAYTCSPWSGIPIGWLIEADTSETLLEIGREVLKLKTCERGEMLFGWEFF